MQALASPVIAPSAASAAGSRGTAGTSSSSSSSFPVVGGAFPPAAAAAAAAVSGGRGRLAELRDKRRAAKAKEAELQAMLRGSGGSK
jgi:hypothetical protein